MATLLACMALAIILLAPETTIGKSLRRLLVEAPARKLNQVRPSHLAAWVLGLGVALAAVAYAKTEGAMLVAQGLPEGIAWFTAFDMATCIDALAVLVLLAATVRLRAAWDVLRSSSARARRWMSRLVQAFRLCRPHGASRELRRRSGARPPKAEDEGWRGAIPSFA